MELCDVDDDDAASWCLGTFPFGIGADASAERLSVGCATETGSYLSIGSLEPYSTRTQFFSIACPVGGRGGGGRRSNYRVN